MSFSGLCTAQDHFEARKIRIRTHNSLRKNLVKVNMMMESSSWFKQKILKKEPHVFSQESLQQDLNRITKLYQKSGYLDVYIDAKTKMRRRKWIDISIDIHAGDPIRFAEVRYNLKTNDHLKEILPRRNYRNIIFQSQSISNVVFSDEAIFNDQLLIQNEFNSVGYPFARVQYNIDADTINNLANVTWTIDKGILARFGPTSIAGNERIPDEVIYRQLRYGEDELWSKKKIDQTQKLIYGQGVFRIVSLKALMNDTLNARIPIRIQIEEAPRWTTRFGAGYGRESGFRAFGEFQYLSFISRTSRISLIAKHSGLEPYNFNIRFSQPSVFIPVNTFSINPYLKRVNEPGYNLKKYGINLSMLQNFSKMFNTSFGIEIEDVKVDSSGQTDPSFTFEEFEYYKKSSFLLGGVFDNSEPLLDPVQGYVFSFSVKSNGKFLFNEVPFNKIIAEYKSYHSLNPRITLALKLKSGVIFEENESSYIPVDERFFAGGSYSVRGWQRSELGPKDEQGIPIGGNSLLEASTEFRILAGKSLIIAVFGDAGNVFPNSWSFHLNDLRYAAGAGLRFITPIGPAGLDFARPIFEKGGWQIHLNIGHSF